MGMMLPDGTNYYFMTCIPSLLSLAQCINVVTIQVRLLHLHMGLDAWASRWLVTWMQTLVGTPIIEDSRTPTSFCRF